VKWFCGNGFVFIPDAGPFSFCARVVTGVNDIAASPAGGRPGYISGAEPIADISRAQKGDSIIATDSVSTVSGGHEPA
jgi:hypothetical protein